MMPQSAAPFDNTCQQQNPEATSRLPRTWGYSVGLALGEANAGARPSPGQQAQIGSGHELHWCPL